MQTSSSFKRLEQKLQLKWPLEVVQDACLPFIASPLSLWDIDQLKPSGATTAPHWLRAFADLRHHQGDRRRLGVDGEPWWHLQASIDLYPTPVRHAAKGHIQTFSTLVITCVSHLYCPISCCLQIIRKLQWRNDQKSNFWLTLLFREENLQVIDISSVREKCVYVEFQGISHAYISKFPNFMETD